MVTTITPYTDSRNRAYTGEGYDGVARISVNGYYGTGVLLSDGRTVLTVAHLFANAIPSSANVNFETTAGSQTIASTHITLLSTYDAQSNNDLALVTLSSSAPVTANRYSLYRSNDEIGQTMTMVGYGLPGTGDTGTLTTYSSSPLRLKANNQFDANSATLKSQLGSTMSWTPTTGTQLMADFDNGNSAQDAFGQLINYPGLGLGQNEGMISSGDSGGPAFINGQIAGIASYTTSLSQGNIHPDINGTTNSSFGEIGAWQRISNYQQWIDQSQQAQYQNAPTKPSEVQSHIVKSNTDTTYTYFLLQFTGVRSDPNQLLSVAYATRDDTAKAGQDYIAASGTLVLYPTENQAVIPVEIIADHLVEPDEIFYLDVFNPVGVSFGEGIIKLTAMRTIMSDHSGLLA